MKFIFEVRVHSTHRAEDYAQAWLDASRMIQQASGALGTELHRDLHDPRRLLAIAHWRSKTERDEMESEPMPKVKAIIEQAAQFVDVSVVGEFDEPEWRVIPDAGASLTEF